MKDNRKTIQVLFILTIIFSVIGGSLAYWNWNTTEAQRTNVVFTLTNDFSCAADGGGNITSNDVMLAPTTCTDTSRTIKRKVTVTPTLNRESMTLSMDLWLTINNLSEGLKKSNNFRYVLTTSSNSCEEGTIMASGNFKGRKEGNKVNLLTNELYVDTSIVPEEYWLYIWLDAAETSSATMNQTFNLSLGGQCEEVETLKGEAYALYTESDQSLTFVRSETPIIAGSEYGGKTVTEVYSGFEEETYDLGTLPWSAKNVKHIEFNDTIRPISTAWWFAYKSSSGDSINISNLDTSQVTDMSRMFYNSALTDENIFDLSSFDVSKVTNMVEMFYTASGSGENINLSNWDVSNVTNMSGMFESFFATGDIILSNWNTSQVTNMGCMFQMFPSAVNVDLSGWNVSNVTMMAAMFSTTAFNSISDLSEWDVSSVTDMSFMFDMFTVNTNMDLSNWDVSNVTDYEDFANIYGTGTFTPPRFGEIN